MARLARSLPPRPYVYDVPLAELRRRISSVVRANYRSLTAPQVQARIGPVLDQFPIFKEQLTVNRVMRARLNQPGELFTRREQVWYPPASKTKLGRLNYPGEVVFYAADSATTALHEIGAAPGMTATIVANDASGLGTELTVGFIGASRSKSPVLDMEGFARRRARWAVQLGNSSFHKYQMVDTLLTALITAPVSDDASLYQPTAALAHFLFDAPLDGVHYPSVKSDLHGLNIALKPDVADRHFRPRAAFMVRFGEWAMIDGQKMLATMPIRRSKAIGDDGDIHWMPDGQGLDAFAAFVRPPTPFKRL